MLRYFIVVLFTLGFSSVNAQSCYVFKDEASGFDVQTMQTELEAKACELVDAFDSTDFADSFKVFSFGFYMDLEYYDEYSYPQAFIDMKAEVAQESPYYLLIGRQSDHTGVFTKFRVEVKLPESDKFWCMTDFDRIVLNSEISDIINQKYSETGVESDFFVAEMDGMDSLKSRILDKITCCGDDPQAKNLCGACYAPNQILAILKSLKFVKIEGSVPLDAAPNSPSDSIEDFANPIVDIDGRLKTMVEYTQSKGYSVKGFITENGGLCPLSSDAFNEAKQHFNSSQATYKIWWHLWKNPVNGEYNVYQLISNYEQFLNAIILSGVDENEEFFGDDCHGTKRGLNIGRLGIDDDTKGMPLDLWEGKLAHIIIETWYIDLFAKLQIPPQDAYGEYAIPHAAASGNTGYADIVNLTTGEIFEIKKNVPSEITSGRTQVTRYVNKANQYCLVPHPPGFYHKGVIFFPPPSLTFLPGRYLTCTLEESGLIVYSIESYSTSPVPAPVPVPFPILVEQKLLEILRLIEQGVENVDIFLTDWLMRNKDIAYFIAEYAVTIIVAVVVLNAIENLATAGAGVADDALVYAILYRVIEIARFIPKPVLLVP